MPARASHRLLVINRSEMRVKMIVNDAESREHKRFSAVSRAIQSILIPTLIVLVVIMMIQIKHLQGTARVINYAGLVRGATQRLVKLEIIGIHDDELVQYLDDILEDLKYDGDSYGLVSLEDVNYQGKLDSMIDYWEKLKKEIKKARDCDYEATDIVAMSETYFGLADETVSAAEAYSDKAAKQMRLVELLSVVDMLILFLLIIEQSLSSMRIIRKNRILEQKAYIDVHTGLPNKSKCEELFSDMSFITEPTACLMFDLNNLKSANDTLGHSAGDQLIASFARVLRNVIPAKDGKPYYVDSKGEYWRSYVYITDASSYDQVEKPEDFYESAVAFGHFQRMLADYPAETLNETIKGFHDTRARFQVFKDTVAKDVCGRAAEVQDEINFVLAHEDVANVFGELQDKGKLPLRVTHNDTKLNNVLLDAKTRRALCVIDLDTVMPGSSLYDFGDSIRFGAATAAEDEKDLSKMEMSLDRFRVFTRGYVRACPGLTAKELELLPMGAKTMTMECGVRFLTDYLDGDHYFAVHREGQNLDRCRTQFKLVADMEKKWDEMRKIVEEESR